MIITVIVVVVVVVVIVVIVETSIRFANVVVRPR